MAPTFSVDEVTGIGELQTLRGTGAVGQCSQQNAPVLATFNSTFQNTENNKLRQGGGSNIAPSLAYLIALCDITECSLCKPVLFL